MAAAAEIQVGKAVRFGCGATALANGATSYTANVQSQDLEDQCKLDKIVSQNGAVIETKITSQRERRGSFKIIPHGATDTRAAVLTMLNNFTALAPLDVITVSGADVTAFNGTYNYEGGAKISTTAEGYYMIEFSVSQVESSATAGTFTSLAVVTG